MSKKPREGKTRVGFGYIIERWVSNLGEWIQDGPPYPSRTAAKRRVDEMERLNFHWVPPPSYRVRRSRAWSDRYRPLRDPKTRSRHLTAAQRKRLRPSQFALPDSRRLPIHDARHVRNAAARLTQMIKRGTVSRHEYKEALSRIWKAEERFKIGRFRKPRGKHGRARVKRARARSGKTVRNTQDRVPRGPGPGRYVRAHKMRSDGSVTRVDGHLKSGSFVEGLRPEHRSWEEAARLGAFTFRDPSRRKTKR